MNRRNFLLGAMAVPLVASVEAKIPYDNIVRHNNIVRPLDPTKIRPSDFADADLDMPYAVTHFARVADSVLTEGPDRGFFSLSVWRGQIQLRPYNARIMENILALAWFYTARQKWNPYRGDPALRTRLELALDRWSRIQSSDGRFSEYGPEQWNLAATSFAVKFVSEALRLLKDGPPISRAIHQSAIDSCRKALHAVLFDPELYRHGRTYSNQYSNIFAGGAAFLAMYPDQELSTRLKERMEASSTDLQSPAGYMYEMDGPDLGYTLNTHHENIRMAYHYWRGTHLGDLLVEEENRFAEWLSFNALPEPGSNFFVLNRSIESRQQHAIYSPVDTPVADRCVLIRAFATTPEHRAEEIRRQREKLEHEWPNVDPLPVGEFTAYTPYRFLQRSHYNWHPTAEQIQEARKLVRPLAESSFIEQRKDTRVPIVFTYVRRPAYYAAFASAIKPCTAQQRLGLTFVWTPSKGVLLQSQTLGRETAWGCSAGDSLPFEAAGVDAEYQDGGARVRYPLPGGGHKQVVFAEDRISVTIEREGEVIERVPVFDPACVVSRATSTVRAQDHSPVPGKNFSVVELRASGNLAYEIRL